MMPGHVLDMHARLREACRRPEPHTVRFMDAHVRTSLLNAEMDRPGTATSLFAAGRDGPPVRRVRQGPVHRDHVPGHRRNDRRRPRDLRKRARRHRRPARRGTPRRTGVRLARRAAALHTAQGRRRRWPPHRDQRRHVGRVHLAISLYLLPQEYASYEGPESLRITLGEPGSGPPGPAAPPNRPGDRPAVGLPAAGPPLAPARRALGEPASHPASTAKEHSNGRP